MQESIPFPWRRDPRCQLAALHSFHSKLSDVGPGGSRECTEHTPSWIQKGNLEEAFKYIDSALLWPATKSDEMKAFAALVVLCQAEESFVAFAHVCLFEFSHLHKVNLCLEAGIIREELRFAFLRGLDCLRQSIMSRKQCSQNTPIIYNSALASSFFCFDLMPSERTSSPKCRNMLSGFRCSVCNIEILLLLAIRAFAQVKLYLPTPMILI